MKKPFGPKVAFKVYTNLSIRGIASSSDHFMQIMPINNFTFWNAPDANLFIQGTTNEVSIVDRIELDARH
jgi:hypothetical protein